MSLQSIYKRTISAARRYSSRIFVAKEDENLVEFVATLREVDIFKTLTRRQLMSIASAFHRRHYKRGEVIYYQGDPGLGLYIVEEGVVTLSVVDDNEEVSTSELGRNEAFGIVSMFADVRRHESATATTQASLLGLFSPELKSLVRRNPTNGAAVLQVLAEFLAETHSSNTSTLVQSPDAVQSALQPGEPKDTI
jgi:CRP-like cAMP-binding protein